MLSSLISIVLLSVIGNVLGLDYSVPGVVQGSFEKIMQPFDALSTIRSDQMEEIEKRQVSQTVELPYDKRVPVFIAYVINMTIGTPPKLASLQVDTGSTDLWFQTLNSATCQASDSSCANFTDYDVSKSSSAKLVGRNVSTLVYGLGNANCDQYNETVSFGNITFQNMPVRVAGQSKGLPFGIVGLGSSDYSTPAIVNNQRTTLPTFLQYMVQNKYIQSQAFSFWLNSSTSGGSIIFGGIDENRYEGQLNMLQMKKTPSTAQYYALPGRGFSAKSNVSSVAQNLFNAVVIDSGSSISFGPPDILAPLYGLVGLSTTVATNVSNNTNPIDCKYNAPGINITFFFQDVQSVSTSITVPLENFVSITYPGSCSLDLVPWSDSKSYMILGDNFLKSVYTVIDSEQQLIGLAPLIIDPPNPKVVAITKGQNYPTTGGTVTEVT